ncbi:hypothetical protein BDY24DRAFT_99277 [Mrakia frigida]|uniref:uncharacterized protein n=1 Tax=Mrakia frigida TaxID=29902 RepID=UPI003FCC193E
MPKPFPPLSWDVLSLIFEQVDPSTLAALGGASFDFLEATSPLLYGKEVAITSPDGLKQLFCEREGTKDQTTSRINPLLSLSQIQILSLDFTQSATSYIASDFVLSSSRIDGDVPIIPLQTLNLTLFYESFHFINNFYDRTLFRWLNPSRFNLTVPNRSVFQSIWFLGCQPLSHWSRNIVVELNGVLLCSYVNGQTYFAGLPPPSLEDSPGRVVRLHLKALQPPWSLSKLVESLRSTSQKFVHEDQMQTGSILLVVGSEEDKLGVESDIALFKPASRRSKFRVVVE